MIALFGCRTPLICDYVESCRRAGIDAFGISEAGVPRTPYDFPVRDLDAYRSGGERHPFIPCAFSPTRRRALAGAAQDLGCAMAEALVDPTAILPGAIRIGAGSFVNAGCVIGAETLIDTAVLVNRATNIGHHVMIGAFASIGPGVTVTGNVRIGEGAVIGAGATILPDLRIGAGAVVAAGSLVRRDVPDGTFVAGSPATERAFDIAGSTLHDGSDE